MTYEKYTSEISGQEFIVKYNEDGSVAYIPTDPANSDYQEYLKSLDEADSL